MAKKNATAAPAAKLEAPLNKKGTSTSPNINIPLHQFWDYADLAWKYADRHLVRLAARRPSLTKQYIADQVAYVAEVKELPGNDVRTATNTKKLDSLKANRQSALSLAGLLEDAIGFAYEEQPQLIPVEVKLAGITTLRASKAGDYAAVSTFLTTAKGYLKNYGQKLLDAGAISPDFSAELETLTTEYNAAKTAYTEQTQTSKDGTAEVSAGVEKIKKAIASVQNLGKKVFQFEPELAKLFTADYLMEEVRSKHPAGLNGRTNWFDADNPKGGKPIAKILVEVLGVEGKSAVTNKDGRYIIKQLAAGEYMVRYSGPIGASEGVATTVQKVTLKAGTSIRLNVVLSPAPVEPAPVVFAPVEATTPTPQPIEENMTDALKGSLKGVGTASTNGVHV